MQFALALGCLALPALTTPASLGATHGRTLLAAATDATNPNEVRAEFLYRFASRYVKWPETAFKDKDAPFTIGILAASSVEKLAREACQGRKVGARSITVAGFVKVEDLRDCHILFVPASEEKLLQEIMGGITGKSTLVVVESIAAVEKGAHIGLYLEKAKTRFAVNRTSTGREKFEIGSELLKLARLIDKTAHNSPGAAQ